MIERSRRSNRTSLAVAILLLVVTFALIGFVTLSVLIGDDFGLGNGAPFGNAGPELVATPEDIVIGTPDPFAVTNFRDTALGFGLTYPKAWKKNEKGLKVIISPTEAGLDPDNLQDAAIWFGIPADNTMDETRLLAQIQANLSPNSQTLNSGTLVIGAESWQSTRIQFDHEQFNGPAAATIAATSRDGVGYYVVAIAPAAEWNTVEAKFQNILNSFHFTSEAVLRPTDATPPPTPTPTPTPVVYIVQSGDTLGKIALQFDVDIETLAARNGIDDPRSLRTGAKLVIPLKRR